MKPSHEQRRHVGQDLPRDDAEARSRRVTTAAATKSLLAQRQRLRAQHARVPRPAGDDQHQRRCVSGPGRQVGGDHDGQRQAGDDQEDVDEQRQTLVDPAAEVAGGHADERADQHDGEADDEADDQRRCARPRPSGRARPGPGRWCRASARTRAAAAAGPRARSGRRRASGPAEPRSARRSSSRAAPADGLAVLGGAASAPARRHGLSRGRRRSCARPACAGRATRRAGPPASWRRAPPA